MSEEDKDAMIKATQQLISEMQIENEIFRRALMYCTNPKNPNRSQRALEALHE